jgi:hypothetical protein
VFDPVARGVSTGDHPQPYRQDAGAAPYAYRSRLNPSTVYRLLNQHGLMKPDPHKAENRRKFEAELANDIWHYLASRIMPH